MDDVAMGGDHAFRVELLTTVSAGGQATWSLDQRLCTASKYELMLSLGAMSGADTRASAFLVLQGCSVRKGEE